MRARERRGVSVPLSLSLFLSPSPSSSPSPSLPHPPRSPCRKTQNAGVGQMRARELRGELHSDRGLHCHERRERPVHLIITMIKWIRTSRLSMKNSLSTGVGQMRAGERRGELHSDRGPDAPPSPGGSLVGGGSLRRSPTLPRGLTPLTPLPAKCRSWTDARERAQG